MQIIGFIGLMGWQIASFAEVPVPALEHHVTDLTSTLNENQRLALENRLTSFEQEKGSQIAVLILATTQPESIEQYSIRVAEQWRLGRKGIDDGVLLLIAKNDHTTRIEVGYGLEGAIPDALTKRIIEDIMIPQFRNGDFAGGIDAGVGALIGLIQGEPLPTPPAKNIAAPGLEQYFVPLMFVAFISGGFFRALFGQFLGGLLNSGLVGLAVWLLGGGLFLAAFLAFMVFLISLGNNRRGYYGGFGGGGFSGGSGGGFSGGGGGFGGGGASGRW